MTHNNDISAEVLSLLMDDVFIHSMMDSASPQHMDGRRLVEAKGCSMADFDEARRIFLSLDQPSSAVSPVELRELEDRIRQAL